MTGRENTEPYKDGFKVDFDVDQLQAIPYRNGERWLQFLLQLILAADIELLYFFNAQISPLFHILDLIRVILEEFQRFSGQISNAKVPSLVGNRHYYCSDYMVHRREHWVCMHDLKLINTIT